MLCDLSLSHAGSTPGGIAYANFAHFDNLPKSCSADFGCLGNSPGAPAEAVESASVAADKCAALADLESSASKEQGNSAA